MRVLHVIPSLSPSQGGPSIALPAMAGALATAGVEVDIVTTDDDGPGKRMADVKHGIAISQPGFRVFYFPKQSEFYKVSLPLLAWLIQHAKDYDVVHVHAVFSFASLAAGWVAHWQRVPFMVRPLGVLNSWGMTHRRQWIKSLSFRLLDRPMLNRAAAMHYTSQLEAAEVGRLKLDSPAAVIPLGIEMRAFDDLQHKEGAPTILFMSRIDPKKGIELLLASFALLVREMPNLRLVIAGDGEPAYVQDLHAKVEFLNIASQVTWAGFLQREAKLAAMASATVFVLPSYSENFGIALLEAMAAGLPCIASDQVALAVEAAQHEEVKVVGCDAKELWEALKQMLNDSELRQRMGKRAAEVARRDYSLEGMAASLLQWYQRVTMPPAPPYV